MNALFVDAVIKTKSRVTGSIPADRAVARVNALDWQEIGDKLDQQGTALIQDVLSPAECETLAALYSLESIFRSRVVMGRHGFGRGEYKYFNYPLPDIVQGLRTTLFAGLAPIANRWNAAMKLKSDIRTDTKSFCRDATTQDKGDRRHCSSSTAKVTSTACTRMFTGSTFSRYR
jgi:hypothetical protein